MNVEMLNCSVLASLQYLFCSIHKSSPLVSKSSFIFIMCNINIL